MKTVGKLLLDARIKKKYSRARLEKETKIKGEFIEAIENEKWNKLPDFPVVAGFINSISQTLGVNKKTARALLRRDYPPRTLPVNPKPDVVDKFSWNPRKTFVTGAILVSIAILGYLGFQYSQFVRPPDLNLEKPLEGEQIDGFGVEVVGKTDPDTSVTVNNQPIFVEEDGSFSIEIEVSSNTTEILVIATSRSGKETVVRRNINQEVQN